MLEEIARIIGWAYIYLMAFGSFGIMFIFVAEFVVEFIKWMLMAFLYITDDNEEGIDKPTGR